MTKDEAVQYLTEMGLDPAAMAGVPDAFLIAVATAWQEEEDTEGDGTPAVVPAGAGGTPRKTAMADPDRQPSKVTVSQTFADVRQLNRAVKRAVAAAVTPALKGINDAAEAARRAAEQRAAEERQAAVRLFCDQRAKEGKLSPADNDEAVPTTIRARLLRLAAQPEIKHEFADPKDAAKKVSKTELQLQLDEIEARPARQFAERVRSGAAGAAGSNEGAAGAGSEHAERTKKYWEDRAKRLARN